MTETEPQKGPGLDLKLKANLMLMGEHNYTLQVVPFNIDWKYSETDAEYRIDQYVIKSEQIKQTIRNILFKNKDLVELQKVGSKDYLFEIQVSKRVDKEKLKTVLSQIGNEIKSEAVKGKTELDSFKKFLEDSTF
ncbi:Uncharacterised protein [uncultured archaeon]|nr:Uncharacterised protein [uncultured archaeon]